MITKPAEYNDLSNDPRRRAGIDAERQMAHYLHRAFATSSEYFVLNDLRIEDPTQPEANGKHGVCQIDHLVVHRFGMFIVESKSSKQGFSIRDDGFGGDEWTRKDKNGDQAIASPLQQAKRQGEFLRKVLNRHAETLLGKMEFGLRTLSKVLHGSDQRGFRHVPMQVIVAISDHSHIDRANMRKLSGTPCSDHICKADLVTARIAEEYQRHVQGHSLLKAEHSNYGTWSMKPEEAIRVAHFLAEQHAILHKQIVPSPQPTVTSTTTAPHPVCKSCSSEKLVATSGKYGYYWKCAECQANTAMPTVCGACGALGRDQSKVRIRKDGQDYWRECAQCGMSEKLWLQK